MSLSLKDLRDKQATIWTRMQELADGELKPEDREAYSTAEADLDAVADQIRIILNQETKGTEPSPLTVTPAAKPEAELASAEQYREAFWAFVRGGMKAVKSDHRDLLQDGFRALSVGTGSEGGFTAPEGFIPQIVEAVKTFSGVRQAPRVTAISTTTANDLPIPTGDDTGNVGALLAENTVIGEQDTTFGQVILKGYTWSSKMIRVSIQLLNDSGVDIEGYLARKLGERIGRAQAPYLVTGTGSGQPEGVVTNTVVGRTTVGGQTTTLLYDDFVHLEHSIDPAYRQVAAYLMSDSALKAARLIKDTQNRPIWVPAMTGPYPATINGFPYFVDNNMATVAASNKPVLFGDLSYYWIRDVQGIVLRRLDERFADYLQVAFLAFSRMDARPVDANDNPWKVLQMAAS